MRVLAIGATGFIGQHLVPLLAGQGHEVHVLHQGEGGALPEGVGDIRGNRDRLDDLPDDPKQPLDWRYALWTDTSAIRRELGYIEPVSLDEALRRSIAWEWSEA